MTKDRERVYGFLSDYDINREGLVFRFIFTEQMGERFSFKVISNKFLLKNEE